MTYNVLFVLFPDVIRNRTVEARKRARENPSSAVVHRVTGLPVESCQDMLEQFRTAFGHVSFLKVRSRVRYSARTSFFSIILSSSQ